MRLNFSPLSNRVLCTHNKMLSMMQICFLACWGRWKLAAFHICEPAGYTIHSWPFSAHWISLAYLKPKGRSCAQPLTCCPMPSGYQSVRAFLGSSEPSPLPCFLSDYEEDETHPHNLKSGFRVSLTIEHKRWQLSDFTAPRVLPDAASRVCLYQEMTSTFHNVIRMIQSLSSHVCPACPC